MEIKTIKETPLFGNENYNVYFLQKSLKNLGFYTSAIDCSFGPKTRSAILALQNAKGIVKSGIINDVTLHALNLKIYIPLTLNANLITRNFNGNRDRVLNDELRLRMESYLFKNEIIPDFWVNKNLPKVCNAVQEAMAFLNIKEVGSDNMGRDVGMVQGTIGTTQINGNGDEWCMDFVQMKIAIIEDYYKKESPVPANDNCVACWTSARNINGLTTKAPTIGSMLIGQRKSNPISGHVMEVYDILANNQLLTVEGNFDSEDDLSDFDVAGFNHRRKLDHNFSDGDLKSLGYVFVYPNNIIS